MGKVFRKMVMVFALTCFSLSMNAMEKKVEKDVDFAVKVLMKMGGGVNENNNKRLVQNFQKKTALSSKVPIQESHCVMDEKNQQKLKAIEERYACHQEELDHIEWRFRNPQLHTVEPSKGFQFKK